MEFWLLVIGGVTIIGVIGFAVASSRGSKRRRRDLERNTTITTSDIYGEMRTGDNDQAKKGDKQGRRTHRQEPTLDGNAKERASDQETPEQASATESAKSNESRQGILIEDPQASADAAELHETPPNPPRDDRTEPLDPQKDHQVLVVYVMARGQGEFRCSGVSRVLTRAGCMLDERGVFQMRDDDQNEQFGIVNAFEPATFELERMDVDTTRGLVFFMEARSRQDRQRFDAMLSLARKLALELDGELLDDKREPLSSVREHTYKADLVD